MPTVYEIFRDVLKAEATVKAFAGERIFWQQVPASALTQPIGAGAVAYRLKDGDPGPLTSCGANSLVRATMQVYCWSMDGCSAQSAAQALLALQGYSAMYLGALVRVVRSKMIEDALEGDAYGCGVELEVHF